MDRILETGKRLAASRFFIPVFLFVISILAYGILIPWLGFYSDDWLFIFISQRFGANGLTSYFSTARPFFQPIFLAITTLLGSTPWHYHLYVLLMHWLCSVSFWWLLSLVWPTEKQRLAFWAALFFLVYPGFQPQPIALTFGNIFLVQAIFLISLASSVAAIRYKKYFWWFTLLGVLGSCVNLFVIEYFYLLELLRPFFIYAAISQPGLAVRERIKQTIKLSGIYAVVLLASAYWRLFLYKYQANVHPYTFPAMFKADPMLAVRTLLGQVIQDLWQAIFAAWKLAFQLPGKILSNTNSLVIYIAAIALTGVLMMAVLQLLNRKGQSEKRFPPTMAWIIAIAGLPLAGIPFWLTGLQIQFDWINSRYTLSYLISLSLLYAAVVLALSPKRWVSNILMTVLIAVSVGGQVINANDYRIDWGQQKDLYWQFSWRMPAIAPGTTVFINEQQGIAGSGTYLMAAVNWIYSNRTDGQLDYRIAYSRESLATLEENSFYIFENNYTGNFNGNPNKVLAANYSGRCLTVLDQIGRAHV